MTSSSTAETAAAPSTSSRPATGAGAGERIRRLWDRLHRRPGGRWLFSRLVGWMAPYTGTMGARVEELGPGFARASLRDRRRVRNHLRSVHAIALMNLAELTSGLVCSYGLPAGLRGIPVHLGIDYLKKARGTITAVCEVTFPELAAGEERREVELPVELTDASGQLVARARARWVIGR